MAKRIESFSGLPGMIKGVALPHEHITWFATMVTPKPVESLAIIERAGGRPVSRNEFKDSLTSRFKDDIRKMQLLLKGLMF